MLGRGKVKNSSMEIGDYGHSLVLALAWGRGDGGKGTDSNSLCLHLCIRIVRICGGLKCLVGSWICESGAQRRGLS